MAPKQKSKIKTIDNKQEDNTFITKDSFTPINVEIKTTETVALLLTCVEKPVLLKCVAALDDYAMKKHDNLMHLCELSVTNELLPLSKHDDICIRRFSIKLLAELCALPQIRTKLLQNETIIPYFVDALSKDNDIVIQEFSSLLLAELSTEHYACLKIIENPILNTLFTKMSSSDPDVQNNSLQIMVNILDDPMCVEEFCKPEEFQFKPIQALLRSEYPSIQTLAIKAIHCIITRRQAEQLEISFCESGGVEDLLDVLQEMEWKDLHHEVLSALQTCVDCDVIAEHMCTSGSLLKLKEYMENVQTSELMEAALAVIIKSARLKKCCQMLHDANMEEELCKLIENEHGGVVGIACRGLGFMSVHKDAMNVIVKENPVRDIMALVRNDTQPMEVRLDAVHAMRELLRQDKRICNAVISGNKQEYFVNLLYSPPEKLPLEMSLSLIMILRSLLAYEDIRTKVVDSDLIDALLYCFQDNSKDDVQLKTHACYALADIMCEAKVREFFLSLGGITHIMNSIKQRNLTLRQAAASLVQVAASDYKLATAFIHVGALDWMLREEQMRTRFDCPVWETAIEALFRSHLSAKFAYTGRLDPNDVTGEGFYVLCHVEHPFPVLEQLLMMQVSPKRPIYVANFKLATQKISSEITLISTGTSSKISAGKQSHSSISQKKHEGITARQLSREHQNITCDELDAVMPSSDSMCVADPYLPNYLEKLQEKFAKVEQNTITEEAHTNLMEKRICVLAEFVCSQMSGPDPKTECNNHMQEMHLNELKVHLGTNVIPLGYIRVGLHLERAMLFKVLADHLGLPCALVRGRYQRSWIEVAVPELDHVRSSPVSTPPLSKSSSFLTTSSGHVLHHLATQTYPQPEPEPQPVSQVSTLKDFYPPNCVIRPNMIVDLMNDVGRLYPINTYEASKYCNRPE